MAARGSLFCMAALLRRLVVAAFLASLFGCSTLSERQQSSLTEGERAFATKDYRQAAEHLSRFLAEVKDRPEAARAYYVRGMALALLGQRAQAYADLRRAAHESTDPQLSWQPSAVLGILSFEDENWGTAAQLFATATQRMPPVPPMDALLFRLGLCCERTGRWAAALTPYRQIVSQFPRGPYAEVANRRLQLSADHFAVQCGVFAQPENANELLGQLQREGLRPYVSREQRRGAPCYVVLEGRYESYPQASAALARVRDHVPQAVLWP